MSSGRPEGLLRAAARAGLLVLAAAVLSLAAGRVAVVRASWFAATATGAGQFATLTVQPPAAGSAQTRAAGGVQVSWSASPTAAIRPVGYLVFRRPSGGGAWTQATPVPVSALTYTDVPPADGLWDYALETAVGGFTSPLSNVVAGLSDRTPPSVTATCDGAPCGAGWYTASVTVALAAADSGSGPGSISWSLDGTPASAAGASATFAVSGDGTHALSYYATDLAGNQGAPQALTVRIDGTPPQITGWAICDQDGAPVYPVRPDWLRSNGRYIVYAQVADAASGVASVTAAVGGGGLGAFAAGVALTAQAGTCAGVSYNFSSAPLTVPGTLAAGATVYADVVAADVAGNVSHTNPGHGPDVGVDNQAPPAPVVTVSLGLAGSGTITLSWTQGPDPGGSGLAGYQVQVLDLTAGGGVVATAVVGPGSLGATFSGLVSGHLDLLLVTPVDNAGNRGTAGLGIATAP